MKLSTDQTQALAAAVGLHIPAEDLENVTIRVSALLESMAQIEAEIGEEIDLVEPIPPVISNHEA